VRQERRARADGLTRGELGRGGIRLSYLRGGTTGDPVLVLHGLAGSAEELAPTAAALVARHRVTVLDQRGHGHSTRRPADLSRRAYADDVIALIDEPVTLIGQSMGAHTALLVAAARPDLVRGLVMLEGGVGGATDDYPARLGRYFASWPVPFPDEAAAVEFLGPKPITAAWVRDLERRPDGLWPRFDADVMEAAIRPVADFARWDAWQRVAAATLLVRGEHGTVDDGEWDRMLALRPDVERVTVPGAGHDVHLDHPEAWITILRDFLNRRSATS
jgi:pimeloyl-ACP methyl ester carboxylesterase